jgi:hypothetical protein
VVVKAAVVMAEAAQMAVAQELAGTGGGDGG